MRVEKSNSTVLPWLSLLNAKVRIIYLLGDEVKSETAIYRGVQGENKPFAYLVINGTDVFVSMDAIIKIEVVKLAANPVKRTFRDTGEYQ